MSTPRDGAVRRAVGGVGQWSALSRHERSVLRQLTARTEPGSVYELRSWRGFSWWRRFPGTLWVAAIVRRLKTCATGLFPSNCVTPSRIETFFETFYL